MLINKLSLFAWPCGIIVLIVLGSLLVASFLERAFSVPYSLPSEPPMSPESIALAESIARGIIKERIVNRRPFVWERELQSRFAKIGNRDAVLRGFLPCLSDPLPEIRQNAAYYLGQFKEQEARVPLLRALEDPVADVRFAACEALWWLRLEESDRPTLRVLMQSDPDSNVRVAAAVALGWPTDDIALAAYRVGLNIDRFRGECEDALEKAGKLELPLPEGCYSLASRESFESRQKAGEVTRIARKNGQVFYESFERCAVPAPQGVCALGFRRLWFVAKENGE
jgi:hypothetical protein